MLPLVLVDGSSYLYRAYYAAKRGFTTSTSLPSGATMIVTRMLKTLEQRYHGCPFLVVFDAKGKSFRADLYKDYKSNRPPMPEDLRVQLEYVQQVVKALGFPMVIQPGVEADDVLGSYAKAAEALGREVVICTGDKDLAQLVSDKITLYDGMKEKVYDREGVKEKFGVYPEHIIDFLALKGDTADNIPGMTGVGDKTAILLINTVGGIKDIEAKPDEVRAIKMRGASTFPERFAAEKEQIELSYKLATIKTDVELPIPLAELTPPVPEHESLVELYRILEFKTLFKLEVMLLGSEAVKQILLNNPRTVIFKEDLLMGLPDMPPAAAAEGSEGESAESAEAAAATGTDGAAKGAGDRTGAEAAEAAGSPGAGADAIKEAAGTGEGSQLDLFDFSAMEYSELENFETLKTEFELVRTKTVLRKAVKEIKRTGELALALQTDTIQAQTCRVIGLSLCPKPGKAYYLPLGHSAKLPKQLTLEVVQAELQEVFADPNIKKYGHNLKFIQLVLNFALDMKLDGLYCDSMLLAHLLNSVQKVSLDELARSYLKYRTLSLSDVTGRLRGGVLAQVSLEEACPYAAEEAEVCLRLSKRLLDDLAAAGKTQQKLFFESEMPFMQVLYHMECSGAYVSADELNRQNESLKEMLSGIVQDIYTAAGKEFNIASTRQLGQILFGDLAIPYPKKPRIGKGGVYTYSTAEEVLQEIAPKYDIANLVLRYRSLSKLISSYTEKLPQLIQENSRIYTSFNQAGTVTGRLSSTDPNLQNIPSRTEDGKHVRRAFCAPEGCVVLSADYSQIELRLIAHISQEPNLLQAFHQGKDIHRATAAEVMGKDISEVTDAERSHAKATNFGLMYGMGSHGLARQTGMTFKAAKAYIDRYFERYPKVQEYMQRVKNDAHRDGYVTTLCGRRIHFADINSQDQRLVASAERAAINAPMQGSAADIIKTAMIRVDEWINTLEPGLVRMTLQVHDELVFEVREDFVEQASAKIKELMEIAVKLDVPLEVGIGVGRSWADAH